MTLRLNGSTSGYIEVDAPAIAGNNTLVLPANNGSVGQALTGNGSGDLSFTWSGGSLFYRLNSGRALANNTSTQSLFGVGVTLESSTVYAFDAVYALHKPSGISSHFVQIGFGGTATVNNILYAGLVIGEASATPAVIDLNLQGILVTSTALTNTSSTALTDADRTQNVTFRGTVSINAGGTFIPQFKITNNVGVYTVQPGSYIRFTPIGTAGSDSSQGTWS